MKRGVESTIKTFYRVNWDNPQKIKLLSKPLFARLYRALLEHSVFTYAAVSSAVERQGIGRIEFYNGRIVPTRAVLIAARDSKISFTAIDESGAGKPIFLGEDHELHDLDFLKARLRKYIDESARDPKLGHEFFANRRAGRPTNDRTFVKGQKAKAVDVQERSKLISIFTSSADELEIAGEQWFTKASEDPASFIKELRDALPAAFELVVRMHPNQAGDGTGNVEKFVGALRGLRGVRVVAPTDSLSTYALIDQSDYVLTFGSTVGLEAAYWGKVSFLAGRAIWEDTGIQTVVASPQDVWRVLTFGARAPDKETAARIGAYFMDGKDSSNFLQWGLGGKYGFFVDGVSYLPLKRSGVGYWVSRISDRVFRYIAR